ncbi:MAG: TatD family hydrolase [Planctomycetota bacterium]
MIDSHAHLTDGRFDDDRDAVLRRAAEAGVELVVCPGTDLADSERALDLAGEDASVLAAVGMDRDAAADVDDAALDRLRALAADERCVAIGEIGLDYHYENVPHGVQRAAFEAQLALATELDLPVIVHCREAFDDCLPMLGAAGARGVLHCFSGDADTALRCCDLGLMVSFAGPVTYKRSDTLRDAARAVPTQHLMIETDSPYLAPQAVRGRRNEPAFVAHTARFLADLLGLAPEDVDRITSTNARLLFGPADESCRGPGRHLG